MKTIYISGKIDGCDASECAEKFARSVHAVSEYVDKRAKECGRVRVINPEAINPVPNGTWFDYMMRDLLYLKQCDTIYMLKDWKDSAGARIEHEFAQKLGLEIIYEEGGE